MEVMVWSVLSAIWWHLRKILGISRIAILENLEIFFWQYGYRFAGKDKTSLMVSIMSSVVHCVAYEWIWIIMNMIDTDTQMEYGIVQIINQPRSTQERLLEESKLEASKRRRTEDGRLGQRISQSNSNTTALHSVCTIKHKKGNIEIFWRLNHNIHSWLFYGIFAFLVHSTAKILQFLGFLWISSYLDTILKECEIAEDLKKIFERWQHWMHQRRGVELCSDYWFNAVDVGNDSIVQAKRTTAL